MALFVCCVSFAIVKQISVFTLNIGTGILVYALGTKYTTTSL